MGLLRRPATPAEPHQTFAVPLTPAETGRLVDAMREADRLRRVHRPDIGGSTYSRSEANALTHRAGVAAALGHPVVPVLVRDLDMYDHVLHGMQQAPRSAATRDLEQLLTRMQMLAPTARLHGWTVFHDAAVGGLRWTTVPTDPTVSPTTPDPAGTAGGATPPPAVAIGPVRTTGQGETAAAEGRTAVPGEQLHEHAGRQILIDGVWCHLLWADPEDNGLLLRVRTAERPGVPGPCPQPSGPRRPHGGSRRDRRAARPDRHPARCRAARTAQPATPRR